jgi:uncharacterized RDD family membrane protein YckC
LNNETYKTCTFLRRVAAIIYDSILLCAIYFCTTFILIYSIGDKGIESGNVFYSVFLIFWAYLYYCWHWVNSRQTLGMTSWNIIVINKSNEPLNWKEATIRYLFSLLSLMFLGLGFVWALFDKGNLALHDRLSQTKLIVQKNKNV